MAAILSGDMIYAWIKIVLAKLYRILVLILQPTPAVQLNLISEKNINNPYLVDCSLLV